MTFMQEPAVKDENAEHPSDMVLDARVFETQDGFSVEIHLVNVP